jgi:putative transposase
MPRRARQLELPRTLGWGGARAGAGRTVAPGHRVRHRRRPEHRAAFPVHVTLRARRNVPSLRNQRMFAVVVVAIRAASNDRFRILQFSVQEDHVHFIVEADDTKALSLGVAALKIRIARRINRSLSRRGALWADRYHVRALRSPREVRLGFVYVLQNWKKHVRGARGLDGRSSARWFDGWAERVEPPPGTSAVARPTTWLAAIGWRRCTEGPLRSDERPNLPPVTNQGR